MESTYGDNTSAVTGLSRELYSRRDEIEEATIPLLLDFMATIAPSQASVIPSLRDDTYSSIS